MSRSVWCTNLPSTRMGPHLVMMVGLCAMPAIVSPAHSAGILPSAFETAVCKQTHNTLEATGNASVCILHARLS